MPPGKVISGSQNALLRHGSILILRYVRIECDNARNRGGQQTGSDQQRKWE